MRIVVLEKLEMTDEQRKRLNNIGDVEFYDGSTEIECKQRIKKADVVVVDWIDPSKFMLEMKTPSMVALMSTGYAWVGDLAEARKKGVLVSNIPGYAGEAVAEHLIGLALCVARQTLIGDKSIRMGRDDTGYLRGIELKGKQIGVVGLGAIGKKVADIAKAIGMKVVTFNRQPKSYNDVEDVPLTQLLKTSDVVCISCPENDESRGLIGERQLSLLKPNAIIVGATWNIIDLDALIATLKHKQIFGAGLDVAIEGRINLPKALLQLDNVVLTPQVGFNTKEAKMRQIDTCISNIEAFVKGKPANIVN